MNALLDAAFYRLGVWGLPLSTAIVNMVGTGALLLVLRRRLGRLELGASSRALARIVLAAAPLAAAGYFVWRALDSALGRAFGAQVVALVVALGVGGLLYAAACRLLGVRELQAVLSLRGRPRRA